MNEATMQDHNFWTTGKDDLWMMESYCIVPSCRIKNLETGEVRDFGIGGLTAKEFEPVVMDKALENKLVELFKGKGKRLTNKPRLPGKPNEWGINPLGR